MYIIAISILFGMEDFCTNYNSIWIALIFHIESSDKKKKKKKKKQKKKTLI